MADDNSSYDGEYSPGHNPHDNDQEDHTNQNLGPGGKKNYYLDPSTFLTSVNQVEKGPKRIDEDLPRASEINSCHTQLNSLVNDLGLKISDVIKGHENDFFIAFKNKMYAIMKEMRELKEKASSERHKAKQEARLVNLEKERDWFRKEALKLDKICKDHKRILNKLKATLENIEEDRDFFQEQLFNAKKVNKALLMEVEKYKKVINSGSQQIDSNSQLQLAYSQPLAIGNEESQRQKHSATKIKNRVDAMLGRGSGVQDEEQDSERDEDDFEENEFEELKSREPSYKPDYKAITGQSTKFRQSQQKRNTNQELATYDSQATQQNQVSKEDYQKLLNEVKELREKENKYVDTIKHLKNQIDNEKKHARTLRADKVNFMTQRNELEEFFLQCIEEVRKEIVKRKTISNYSSKSGMKKSSSQMSLQKKEDQNAKLDNFTATDKRKVIELLMSNENVLLFLYEKLFPVSTISQQSTQSRGNTAPYSHNNQGGSGLPSQNMQYRFMTDSGIPIQTQNRSQTTVGGTRLNYKGGQEQSNQQLPFGLSQDLGSNLSGALQSVIPQGGIGPGMNIQNNIQNINLNINMAKGGYGSQPYIPQKIVRGSTAPLGQSRQKKSYQTQLNAVVGNKYQL